MKIPVRCLCLSMFLVAFLAGCDTTEQNYVFEVGQSDKEPLKITASDCSGEPDKGDPQKLFVSCSDQINRKVFSGYGTYVRKTEDSVK